jgi:hypothetical protein
VKMCEWLAGSGVLYATSKCPAGRPNDAMAVVIGMEYVDEVVS